MSCRACSGPVEEFFDFGRHPLSDAFLLPEEIADEFFYRLAVGVCKSCTMVQLTEEVPRDRMFREDYPYQSSMSSGMRDHFTRTAHQLMEERCHGADPFVVEIGCNDGVMLKTVAESGIRHLGVDPSRDVVELAADKGVQVLVDFFQRSTAAQIKEEHGPADVIYAANTICHIPYLDSVFEGVDTLLTPDGVFVFEDPYLGDVVERTSFDQIYDEHFYLFSASSVRATARRFGFELVDVERLPVHGGEVRYTIARAGHHEPTPGVAHMIAEENRRQIVDAAILEQFAMQVKRNCEDLVSLIRRLRESGHSVAAYGATAKSATVTNYCGIGTDLVSHIFDSTSAKQGRVSPGMHIPIRSLEDLSSSRPDYLLLFAWNHAEEIIAREAHFREKGGKWILYVPEVHVV